jgi:hypothetical protein
MRRKEDAPPPQRKPEPPSSPPEIDPALLKKLEFLGAKVSTTADGHVIDIRRRIVFPTRISIIVQCPQIAELTLEAVQIINQGLEKLRPLKHVKRLILNDCAISPEGMENAIPAVSRTRRTYSAPALRDILRAPARHGCHNHLLFRSSVAVHLA